MRVLGIDPGLVRTGWALVQSTERGATVPAYGLIQPETNQELQRRLAEGARELRKVMAEQKPELVVLEELFTAPNHPRSALLMAHMRGVICLVVEEAGAPLLPLTATTVKQRLTGNGHASKQQVQGMVQRLTGLDPAQTLKWDVTDAIALGIAGLHQREHAYANPTFTTVSRTRRARGVNGLPADVAARIGLV